jgi:hypothetical protein
MRTRRKLALIGFALSQIRATCSYAPPPVLMQGQGGDTLGAGRFNAGAEVGYGANGSWWNAQNVGDPDVNAAGIGAVRVRAGISENWDVGVVGGAGPDSTFVASPEVKWRFAQLHDDDPEGAAFHASLVSGLGFGVTTFRYGAYDVQDHTQHAYIAPYTGVLVSGGISALQMFSGLRFAASQTLGTMRTDLTLYPVLAFGVEVRPDPVFHVFVETDVAGGLTASDFGHSGILGSITAGASVTFGRPLDRSKKANPQGP